MQVPQEGAGSLDRLSGWANEPVRIPRIIHGQYLSDQGDGQG
ncbi:hypothetical protein [Streptomyces sp. NPDC058985]